MFFIAGCRNENSKIHSTDITVEKKNAKIETPEYLEGKKYFNQYCMACHMQDGMGVPGMNPPLVKTSWVLGDKARLIGVVLNGLSGDIEINGELYSNSMGSFATLEDKEIALVLSYVRQSFGNDAGPVTQEEVAKVRASIK
ncbi:c-type cytochrome [Aestuariibaculum suncheonense]